LLLAAPVAFAFPHTVFFEENRGQANRDTQFLVRGNGYVAAFSPKEICFMGKPGHNLFLRFPGSRSRSAWEPLDPQAGTTSSFIGNDPSAWVIGVPHFSRLIRRDVYPGIDVVFHDGSEGLEYDFVVHPGADPGAIRIGWRGASHQLLTASGDLAVEAAGHTLVTGRPHVFQSGVPVSGRFDLNQETGETRFRIGPYDPDQPLTIDPVLDALGFFGGTGNERITAVRGAVVVGVTDQGQLGGQLTPARGTDIFIWNGQSYTLIGGSGDEEPTAISTSSQQDIIVGWTSSADFPFMGPGSFQPAFGGGKTDGFILQGAAGGYSVSASYLGGSGDDRILAFAPSPASTPTAPWTVAGETNSPDFPTRYALQPALAGGKDGFLTRVGSDGLIVESTYWGGSGDDSILALDTTSATCWFAGRTNSPDLRTQAPLQAQFAGSTDAFLARISTTSLPSQLDFATYYGGSGDDEIRALRIGPDSWIWTGGNTTSGDLPLVSASQSSLAGDTDAWLARFDPAQFVPSFITYWGGAGHDELTAIAHDANGDLYATGFTNSPDIPVIDALQNQPGGGDDGFVARFDRFGQPRMTSYAGGPGTDRLRALSVSIGTVNAVGESDSPSIAALTPPAPSSYSSANSGGLDGILVQFHEEGIYALPMALGQNLTAPFLVNVVGAGNSGLPVSVISTDPSRLLVNGGSFSTSSNGFTLTALAGDGTVDVVVSVPGLNPRHVPISLAPSYLLNPPNTTVSLALNSQAAFNFSFGTLDPSSGQVIVQAVRQGLDPAVTFISADTSVVLAQTSYNSVSQTVGAFLKGVGAGTVSVSVVSPLFPIRGANAFKVRVAQEGGAILKLPDIFLGRNLQTSVPLTLSPSSPAVSGPWNVTFTSEDTSLVLLSDSPGKRGGSAVTLTYSPSFSPAPKLWVQARANTGIVRIRAEAVGSDPLYFNVAVAPAIAQLAAPQEAISAYFSGVHHSSANNNISLNLWSTYTTFGLIVQPAGPAPAGYTLLSQLPSPEAANRFNLASSDSAVIPFSGSIAFDEASGTSYGLAYASLLKAGTAILSVAADGFVSGSPIQVTVLPRDIPVASSALTLGKGLQTVVRFPAAFGLPANVRGTVTSGDPSRVLVSPSSFGEATKADITIGNPFYVSALSDSGDVPLTITAPGFNSRTITVHLAPLTFRLMPGTLTTPVNNFVRLYVTWNYPGAPTGFSETTLRPNTSFQFSISVSDSTVVQNNSSSFTFFNANAGPDLRTVGTGTATVTLASASAAVVDPAWATATVTAIVALRTFSFSSAATAIGKDLQRPLPALAYLPNPTGPLTLRSSDPTRLLLSSNADQQGKEVLTGVTGQVFAQALADSGDVKVIASADGFADASLTVRLLPTAFGLFDSNGDAPMVAGTIGSLLSLRVAPTAIDPASGTPIVMYDAILRSGLDPFTVDLQSSDLTVGRLLTPIAFLGGLRENTTQLRAFANGVTEISAVAPQGYADGGSLLHRTVRIAPPQLTLSDVSLGRNMQLYHQVSVAGATPGSTGPSFTVTSSDPARLLVSASPLTVGAASATIGSGSTFYVQAIESSGDVTLTATATGYTPAEGKVHLEPSWFAFVQSPGDTLFADTEPIAATSQPLVYLTHPSYRYPKNVFLRPGIGSVTVPVASSDPGVLQQTAPLVFAAGDNAKRASFFTSTVGSATLQITAPDGFDQAPDALRTLTVKVNPRSLSIGGVAVGKDRAAALNYFGSDAVVEQPTSLHATVSDPSLALLSLSPTGAGTPDLSIDLKPHTPTPAVYVFGLASGGSTQLTVTGPGFTTASGTIVLSPAGFTFSNASLTLAKGASSTIRVLSAQPLRGGSAPVTVAMTNSNPAVAQASPAVFNPGDGYMDIAVTAKSSGITLLTITDNGGSSAASSLVVNVP
jgi:hypothetical protein